MYLTIEQSKKLFEEFFENIKIDYTEKFEFLSKLIEGDDWSFVIKSHALIESLVTELIVAKISEIELKKVIERMPLHGETVSKVSILKIYQLVTPEEIKFICKLSEIRNSIVHKYENIDFTFERYVSTLNTENKKNWKKLLTNENIDRDKMEKLILEQPMMAVWFNLFYFIIHSLSTINEIKNIKRLHDEAEITTKEFLKIIKEHE
ncbi:hypothetical protein B0A79_15380 [Flavobacterium piscis]|uniref:DUF86 domain-containing protein n=1 Tax=Flavobacterium piscis TaxID=1114874 RepID=A0ABX2XHM1_9FLAO|nr:hypothetical protein [Flavobacterium piscis]OCB73170.1 hypothetical protein FLP_10630 [Flavobacterium piscis]OXG02825.1 hypothetical protein B0A79_15380 [Flavobacterium piscis]